MGEGRKKGPGGGGASLNFKVVAYATEELLMAATGKDNEIGIITSTPMTGWYFAAEQPENMKPGEVWISTGTVSPVEFNALRKNAIVVYPIAAKQMVDEALVPRSAKVWKDGEWVQFSSETTYLFNDGDQCKSITGGWSKSGYSLSGFNSADNSLVTIGDSLVCKAHIVNSASGTDEGGACGTVNKVTLTGFTKMRVKGNVSGYRSEVRLYVGVNTSKSLSTSPTAKISLTANGNFDKTLTLPSSPSSYYVFVLAAVGESVILDNTSVLTVNSISLE